MRINKKILFRFIPTTINSSGFAASFRGISRLSSAFIVLQRFKLAHVCVLVISLHQGGAVNSIRTFLVASSPDGFWRLAQW